MSKLVTLTIDGKQVTVPAGTLIVDAAKQVGVDIPVFCYHPKMEPAGMCRMCLVEVGRPVIDRATGQPVLDENGQPQIRYFGKLETACTNPVSEGMVVKTQTEKATAGRKEILEFLLTSHPLDCPICDKGGECALQDLTLAHGPAQSRFLFDEKFHNDKHVPLGDLIYLDRERCIQCGRCIRFQKDVAGDAVIQFYHRGRATEIITISDPGFDSLFSGNTTDICPVGALTTADFRFGARPWELKAAASICSQCPVGCNIVFNTRREVKSGGQVVIKRVMPRQNEEVNELWICDKGRFAAYHYAESEDRLTAPLMRRGADELQPVDWETALDAVSVKMGAVGPQVTVLASGRLSNEDLFNLKALADDLGGKALLYSDMGGGEWTLRYGLSQGDNLGELGAEDAIVVAAADLYEEAPIWYLRVKAAAERGARLYVLNTRDTRLDKYASQTVRYASGQETAAVEDLPVDELKSARRLVVFYGADGLGRDGSAALAAACGGLLEATGHENGLVAVWPRVNDQGAWELGFRPADDLAAAFKDQVVYIVGADPAGDDPALAEALKAANAVIVQDLFLTATAQLADVVLPARAYTEREGTYTSGERRVQRFYPATPPRGESRPDYAITAQIAAKLGIDMEGRGARLVMERIAAAQPAFAEITYGKLAEVREQYPLVDPYYTGTAYRNGQGMGLHLSRVTDLSPQAAAAAAPSAGEGLLALPFSRAYDRGTTVWPSALLRTRIGEPFVVLHPSDAERLGLNGTARLQLGGQEYAVAVVRDEGVTAGTVLVPRSMGLPIHAPQSVSLAAQSER